MNKQLFLRFVRAINKLVMTDPSRDEELLAAHKEAQDAKDALVELQNSNQARDEAEKLTDDEQSEVDKAIVAIAAATPPDSEEVDAVQADHQGQ